jgi:hypothetical protein
MAESNPAGNAAASPPQIDVAALADAIGKSIAAQLQPLHEAVGKLSAPAATAAKEEKHKPLTADDIAKIVGDKLAVHDSTQAKRAARDNHARAKMKDVPAAYLRDLPETDDQAALDAAEQRIRTQYRADLKAAGITAPPVGSAVVVDTVSPGELGKLDVSKMSSTKKIEGLIASSRPSMRSGAPESASAQAGEIRK